MGFSLNLRYIVTNVPLILTSSCISGAVSLGNEAECNTIFFCFLHQNLPSWFGIISISDRLAAQQQHGSLLERGIQKAKFPKSWENSHGKSSTAGRTLITILAAQNGSIKNREKREQQTQLLSCHMCLKASSLLWWRGCLPRKGSLCAISQEMK